MSDSQRCVADWCADDEWCAITCTAEVVGRKWHPVILDRLLEAGPHRFSELQERVDGVSSTVLSDSLADLESHDVVTRTVLDDRPVRVEYSLTERGRDLQPVIDAMRDWGDAHASTASTDC